MKIFLWVSATLILSKVAAQTNPEQTIILPAKTVSAADAGVNDKQAVESSEPYRIEAQKNAQRVKKIKARRTEHQQKQIKKYKGRKADTTKTK